MTDREKVIKGLECCLPMMSPHGFGHCSECPYKRRITLDDGIVGCCGELIYDALELLKEQEPVRCKDCKYSYFASNRVPEDQCLVCGKHGIDVTDDWYCADGERRRNK